MRKATIILLVLVGFVVLSSCNSPQHFLSEFESFVVEVEEGYDSYSSDDWDEASEAYSYYTESFNEYRNTMTAEEKRQYGHLKARCDKLFVIGTINKELNVIDDVLTIGEGYIEELLD